MGSIDWHENNASGVSELIASLINDLKTPKVAMDEQMATALLTGIVAATDRFSNDLTSSGVMSIASELMAAGAKQQLVVSKIDEANKETEEIKVDEYSDETTPEETQSADDKKSKEVDDDSLGSLSITHRKSGDLDEVARQTKKESQENSARFAEEKLASLTVEKEPEAEVEDTTPVAPAISQTVVDDQPTFAGTLNATTEQAEQDKRRELEKDHNKTEIGRAHV